MVHSSAILEIELKFKFVPQRVLDHYQTDFNIDVYGTLAKISDFLEKYGIKEKIVENKIYSPYFFLSNDTGFRFFKLLSRKKYESDTIG